MLKLYRVFGFVNYFVDVCGRRIRAYEPVKEIYFRDLQDAMSFVDYYCEGYWEIFCGGELVARSSVPEDL